MQPSAKTSVGGRLQPRHTRRPGWWITPEAITLVRLPLRRRSSHAACGERATPPRRSDRARGIARAWRRSQCRRGGVRRLPPRDCASQDRQSHGPRPGRSCLRSPWRPPNGESLLRVVRSACVRDVDWGERHSQIASVRSVLVAGVRTVGAPPDDVCPGRSTASNSCISSRPSSIHRDRVISKPAVELSPTSPPSGSNGSKHGPPGCARRSAFLGADD